MSYESKPVAWTMAPTSSTAVAPFCATRTWKRPGAPDVCAMVAPSRTAMRGCAPTFAAIAATPVGCGSACGAFHGTRFHSFAAQPPSSPSFSTRTTS